MARLRQPGTPDEARSRHPIYPERSRRLVAIGLLSGAVVLAGSLVLYLAGQRAVLSPGDVSAHHARVDLKCAQCHNTGAAVESIRCERCHDPSGSDRMLHAAHVLFGSGDRRLADQAADVACATCHTDHRGRRFVMQNVDDRECGSCHTFSSLRSHPEFAAVRAAASAGVGIDFDHDRHIVEAQKAKGATCQTCHEQTPDRRGFQPMNFDRHCASCHLKNGLFEAETDFVAAELMLLPTEVPESVVGATRPEIRTNPRGKRQATGLRHRDPWLLYNASRLRRGIDREGDEAERLALRATIQYFEQLQNAPAPRAIAESELDAAIQTLQQDIASIDERLAAGASSETDAAALGELTAAAQAVASSLSAFDSSISATPAGAASPSGSQNDPDAGARLDRRKAELLALIEAIARRSPESPAATRAQSLRTDVQQLALPPAGAEAAEPAALAERLDRIADVLRPVRSIPDSGVRAELGGIDGIRQLAVERASLALPREEFEGRRRELLMLLDGIEQRAGEPLRIRIAGLRQRAVALNPGDGGDDNPRRLRAQRRRQLDRLLLERELASSSRDRDDPPAPDPAIDRAELGRAIGRARTRLIEIERAPRMTAPTTEDERLDRANGLEALLSPCLKCHELDASRARMAPVRIAEPVMARSVFNHAPHLTETGCESCHAGVRTSKYATDVNVPGVGQCATCHKPSQVRANCATCHNYHPPSALRLLVSSR